MHATDLAAGAITAGRGGTHAAPLPARRLVSPVWPFAGLPREMFSAIALGLADLAALSLALVCSWFLTTALFPAAAVDWQALAASFAGAVVLASLAVGLYPGIGLSAVGELRQIVLAVACIAPVFIAVSLQSNPGVATQVALVSCCLILIPAMTLLRRIVRAAGSRSSWWGQRCVVAGNGPAAVKVYEYLRQNTALGLRPLGIVGDPDGAEMPHSTWLGGWSRIGAVSRRAGGAWWVLVGQEAAGEARGLPSKLRHPGPHRVMISHLDGSPSLWRRASACLDWPGDSHATRSFSGALLGAKRVLDVALTLVAGVVLLPLMLAIALAIKFSSPGPVIFRQERVGLHGRRFLCWKFRTMVCDGQKVLDAYLAANPERMAEWNRDHKLQHDPRVTAIGRLLRKTSLDELPQLWNVLKGEMSLVGPRPILAAEIPDFGESFDDFASVLPGITGLWQVSGRNQTTYAEHVELDSFYARHWSLWLDLYILALTIKVVLFRQGAY